MAVGEPSEAVHMSLPASTDYVRVARLATAGIAERVGFDYEEIDDLRIAVDELYHVALEACGGAGSIDLTFDVAGDSVAVQIACAAFDGRIASAPTPLSLQILSAIVDEYESTEDGPRVCYRFSKRREL